MHPLITPRELNDRLDDVVVCDVRWRLADSLRGHALYVESHIPEAVFVDLDKDLSDPPGSRGRHPLPSISAFEETLGRLGINNRTTVVAYDDLSGLVAARLWWMLRAIGHTATQVLDGGLDAWIDAGFEVESGEYDPKRSIYEGGSPFTGVVDIESLEGRAVVDVRAAERYRGDTEPVDPRPGHIPGAINIPAADLLEDGRLLPPTELRQRFGSLSSPVMSCGSGVNASLAALAYEVAHGSIPDVYPGSYSEWVRSSRPVAKGIQR